MSEKKLGLKFKLAWSSRGVSLAVQVVYLFLIYTLVNSVFATFLNGSNAIYMARAIEGEQNKIAASSFCGVAIMIGCIIFSIIMPQLILYMGINQTRWSIVIGIMGVLYVKML